MAIKDKVKLYKQIPGMIRNAQSSQRDEQYLDVLGSLRNRIGQADMRSTYGVREFYGPQIDRLEDRIRSQANQTRSNLARLSGLSGADPTGKTATAMAGIDEQANESIGDVNLQYQNMADQLNERALGRGDNLTRLLLGGEGNYMNLLETRVQREADLARARKQNRNQILGDLLGVAGTIGAAALCWVAIELYGKDSIKTALIRAYVMNNMEAPTLFGVFCRLYRKFGKRWAVWVRRYKPVRAVALWVYDRIYLRAVYAPSNDLIKF